MKNWMKSNFTQSAVLIALAFTLIVPLSSSEGISAVAGKFRGSPGFLSYKEFASLSTKSQTAYIAELRWFFQRIEIRIGPDRTGTAVIENLFESEASADDDQIKYCVVAGYISIREGRSCKISNATQPSLALLGGNKCSDGTFMCNPLMFGYANDGKDPICVSRGPVMTKECGEKSPNSAADVAKKLRNDPSLKLAYENYASAMAKLCLSTRPDECNAMDAFRNSIKNELTAHHNVPTFKANGIGQRVLSDKLKDTNAAAAQPKAETLEVGPEAQTGTAECDNTPGWTTVCSAQSEELSCQSSSYDLERWKKETNSIDSGLGALKNRSGDGVDQDVDVDSAKADFKELGRDGLAEESIQSFVDNIKDLMKTCEAQNKPADLEAKLVRGGIKGTDGSTSYTYFCRRNAEEKKKKKDKVDLTYTIVPSIRLIGAGDRGGSAYVEIAKNSSGSYKNIPASTITRLGDSSPFAARTPIPSPDGLQADPHDINPKDQRKIGSNPKFKPLTFNFKVAGIGKCAERQVSPAMNWIKSKTENGKTRYVNCEAAKADGPWILTKDSQVSMFKASEHQLAASKTDSLIFTETDPFGQELSFNVDPKEGVCHYANQAEPTDKISSTQIKPSVSNRGSGSSSTSGKK